ncbi:MAG: hypothetical protein JW811_10675 [Clostridiales bacterium]|nr:hypothetical protein [Clostridiales bacterium]
MLKCPECGRWNRAALPHCKYCGTPLAPAGGPTEPASPSWQHELKDEPKQYILVDELGGTETRAEYRDTLADEMVNLHRRKREGEARQKELREQAAKHGVAPSARTVRTTSNRSTFFSKLPDNPEATLRPVDSRLVEDGSPIASDARLVRAAAYQRGGRLAGDTDPYRNRQLYDSYDDVEDYVPEYQRTDEYEHHKNPTAVIPQRVLKKKMRLRRIMLLILIAAFVALIGWIGVKYILPIINASNEDAGTAITITPTIRDDLAAHTITISGNDGDRISLRELRTSAIVMDGIATFDIMDYSWYDDSDTTLEESMEVTLSPYLITESGKQTPLETISYTVDIPLSYIELYSPGSQYTVVSTALYTIVFYVSEGSKVYINGEDFSDLVAKTTGQVSYNATVQPIGENTFDIVVRSPHCRENSMTVTLYREKQAIPLDLSSDISNVSNYDVMTIRATTIPGAMIHVLSPYTDLNITDVERDGSFTFKALFDTIGNNTIIITADYPGKPQTRLEYAVYYVPSVDKYSRVAWDIVRDYKDLMDNMPMRVSQNKIYECIGEILSIETTRPQRAFMECTSKNAAGTVQIYVENQTKTVWEVGERYRLYGDAYGMYSQVPWLVVRYTYRPRD